MPQSPQLTLHVLGAGCDVGRSCIHAFTPRNSLLLDCGAHPAFADERRFPDFTTFAPDYTLATLDAILISHFHLDHAAALPFLTEKLGCPAPVYMTEPTRELASLMLADFVATSVARKQYCPFTMEDVSKSLAKVKLLKLGSTERVGREGNIAVTPFYAGHVLGAVMLHVEMNGVSILYSGDYSIKPDRHLRAATVPFKLKPDVFITEATYCSTVRREGRASQEDEVMKNVIKAVKNGGKVLVPISAFGRVQAVCALFAAHPDADLLANIPLYVVSGLASKANDVYTRFENWTAETTEDWCTPIDDHMRKGDEDGPSKCTGHVCPFIERLQPFNRNEHDVLLDALGPMILFATPGNMSTGLSKDVFKRWASDGRNVVVVPGFCFSNTLVSRLLTGKGLQDEQIPHVKCRLVNLTFSSHVDARGIVRTCRQIEPRAIVLVHGERTKILNFKKQLSEAFKIECHAPSNGQKIIVQGSVEPNVQTNVPYSASLSSDWRSLIDTYIKSTPTLSNGEKNLGG